MRATGVAISYNIAVTCFGGMAPLIVTWISAKLDGIWAPATFQIATAILSLILVAVTLPRARALLLQDEREAS